MAFWGDLASKYIGGRERWAKPLITFLPPLVVVLIWPNLFLVALDVAGGLGLGIFIGLAPALVLILRRPPGLARAPSLGRVVAGTVQCGYHYGTGAGVWLPAYSPQC